MDVVSLSIDIEEDSIDSRYRFVVAAAKRAKQLNEGARPTRKSRAKKMVTLALEEVASGSVNVLSGEAALRAEKEKEMSAWNKMFDEAGQKQTEVEDTTEIESTACGYSKEGTDNGKEFFPW